jgi:serine/threonine protein kinase
LRAAARSTQQPQQPQQLTQQPPQQQPPQQPPQQPQPQVESVFLVSEFVGGGTLKATVMKQLTMPHTCVYTLPVALRWCIDIAAALAYCHEAMVRVRQARRLLN